MKRYLLVIAFIVAFPAVNSQPKLWGEIWSHHNFATTNLSDKQDFFLNNIVLRAGPRFFLSQDTFTLSLDPYLETQLLADILNSHHPNIYNHNIKVAAGLKLNWRHYKPDRYFQFMQVDLYVEYRRLWVLSPDTREQYEYISHEDLVGGIRVWSNSDNRTRIGYELWCDLMSYRHTNFAVDDENDYLINTLSTVLLFRPFTSREKSFLFPDAPLYQLALYINPEITNDLLRNMYNGNPYSNRFLARGGIMWMWPIRYAQNQGVKRYIHLKLYTDYTYIYWIENSYPDWILPNSDFRAGIVLYFPLGDNKMVKWRI